MTVDEHGQEGLQPRPGRWRERARGSRRDGCWSGPPTTARTPRTAIGQGGGSSPEARQAVRPRRRPGRARSRRRAARPSSPTPRRARYQGRGPQRESGVGRSRFAWPEPARRLPWRAVDPRGRRMCCRGLAGATSDVALEDRGLGQPGELLADEARPVLADALDLLQLLHRGPSRALQRAEVVDQAVPHSLGDARTRASRRCPRALTFSSSPSVLAGKPSARATEVRSSRSAGRSASRASSTLGLGALLAL